VLFHLHRRHCTASGFVTPPRHVLSQERRQRLEREASPPWQTLRSRESSTRSPNCLYFVDGRPIVRSMSRPCLVPSKLLNLVLCKKNSVTSNLWYIHEILNVDEIKN
jgi:hypothetical protein